MMNKKSQTVIRLGCNDMMIQGLVGITVFVLIAFCLSENRSQVNVKTIAMGIFLQIFIALVFLKVPVFKNAFLGLNAAILSLEAASRAGTAMVFGYLGGGDLPFTEKYPGASFILAFQALPLILLMSALSSLLFYWKVLPWVVRLVSKTLQKIFGLGGAEGVGVAANIFVGMVEAPLFIRPYLTTMTRSELFSIMTSGMATIAGTVMVLYASILGNTIPDVLGHILVASIISAPAAVMVAKVMIPETLGVTSGDVMAPQAVTGSMDAVTRGTVQGVELLINVVAMLIVLIALVHLVDLSLGLFPDIWGGPLTLKRIFGWLMAPVAWLMGVPWEETPLAGSLMGTKTILNEFLAYLELSRLPEGALSPESRRIMIYAMCGFANPGSLGIMIGGLGTMAPERRSEIVALGLRSVLAGTLATCMTGAVVGIISGVGSM